MPRRRALTAGFTGAGAIAVAALVLTQSDNSGERAAAADESVRTPTTTITRRDLVETYSADGTLGYAGARTVTNRLVGTLTWLPGAGRIVRIDNVLYKVDGKPVVLMDGRVPAYRPLGPTTSSGTDVRQLEHSLRAAGYDRDRGITVDGTWDSGTTGAIKRWQAAHGLPQTGAVEPGRIDFEPGARRVADVRAAVGALVRPGVPLLATTSTRREVSVALDTTKASVARDGARVTVVLPSDKRVRGRITSVGKVATNMRTDPQAPPSDLKATIAVKVRLLKQARTLDQAPVTVRFEQSRRRNVLAIPVTALLARPGGKFAVQVVEGGATRIVMVKPGLYTSGYVEIAGGGLSAGERVTNAAVQ
jgi:Putative peptidoglycan binding domain